MGEDEYESLSGGRRTFWQRFKFPIIAIAVFVIAILIVFGVVWSARLKSENKKWDEQIQTAGIMGHLQQLQNIANANGGTRAASTSGYNASVAYVFEQLKSHGYEPVIQDFNYTSITPVTVSNMTLDSPTMPFNIVYGTDFFVMGGPEGSVAITNASVLIASNFGCNLTDYDAIPVGTEVIGVSRGICAFTDKVIAAATKNPKLVIIYNEGNAPDRLGAFSSTVGLQSPLVLSTSFYTGKLLATSTVTVSADLLLTYRYTSNVIAETKGGLGNRVIVVGSHLDSVPAGPGINDNGSGSALNLELAILLSKSDNHKKIKNKVRFCWFGGEELGLLGSNFYVSNLNETNRAALANISVNLNFDMIGSPNFIRGVYNGSSDTHPGSAVVQNTFNAFYASKKIEVTPTAFTGRSDYGPFLAVGIPAGGLFTGAEEVKTMDQRKQFGGLAGAWLDPCYHQACDTIDNINQEVVLDMAQGAAHALETLATNDDLQKLLNTRP